jgi:hypothetical protein
LANPDQYIFGACEKMRKWAETIPENVPALIREQFELETLCSYIYVLGPTRKMHTISDSAKVLTFEYCIAYARKLLPIAWARENTAFYTFHDALRVYWLGRTFITTLSESEDLLLNGVPPVMVYAPGPDDPPIPLLQNLDRSENASRAVNCINQMINILEAYGSRWEQAAPFHDGFKDESAPILARLRQRAEATARSSSQNGVMPYSNKEPPPDQGLTAPVGGDNWVGFLPVADGTSLSLDSSGVKQESYLISSGNNVGFPF